MWTVRQIVFYGVCLFWLGIFVLSCVGCGTVYAQESEGVVLPTHTTAPLPYLTLQRPLVPLRGLDTWAKWVLWAGPVANIATQEYAFCVRFDVCDTAIPARIRNASLSLGLAGGFQFLSRWMTRGQANGNAVVISAWGGVDAGRNIYVMVTVR